MGSIDRLASFDLFVPAGQAALQNRIVQLITILQRAFEEMRNELQETLFISIQCDCLAITCRNWRMFRAVSFHEGWRR